ncbi:homoaconitase [bacterium]|nr:homoaconitase [bacterium]MBU1071722.1 homoaconitase [bacterium]MBU1674843.1 homoaconitase [bacterium]
MAQTVIEKIAQSHAVDLPAGTELHAGDFVTLVPDQVMTHDNTAAVLLKFETLGVARIANPGQPVFALDHDIQNRSAGNLAKYAKIEAFARSQGVDFYPAGTGIGHQVMIENGYVKPGGFCVASDSHANMYGAVSAVGTPVVRTDAAALWATGRFWWQIPRTVRVRLSGELQPGVTGKDVILTLCGLYNRGEVLNAAVEFAGPGVETLSMDARMTIANMTTEWGALVGWFPCDAQTLDFLRKRRAILGLQGLQNRLGEDELAGWERDPLRSDPSAAYAGSIALDLGEVTPHVAGPDTVQRTAPLTDLIAADIRIHKAYLLSCVNSRLEDLKAAADVLLGRKVADGVELYVAAASQFVEDQAKKQGYWQILLDAGAIALPPSCGPCIGLGTGLLEAGEVGISATNRNFKGRMGSRDAKCYLASPVVVAASAVAGRITGPEEFTGPQPAYAFAPGGKAPRAGAVEILDGFPARIEGRGLWLDVDNLNTDGIYGKDYTYREDMTPRDMARVVMENYDPAFTGIVAAGDVLIGGFNFGTGSSREQAVTALQAAGVALLIAGSYSQTYLRNAINNGFICLESTTLVDAVRAAHAGPADKTVVMDGEIAVDFARAAITWQGGEYAFAPLGRPVQEVIIAGGVENQVREALK